MSNFTRSRGDSTSSPVTPLSATPAPLPPAPIQTKQEPFPKFNSIQETPLTDSPVAYSYNGRDSPGPQVQQRERASSRPMSMVQTYQPPLMDVAKDTLPELQPIFTFLNSHGNKLYQEGYFLKLDDQDTCT